MRRPAPFLMAVLFGLASCQSPNPGSALKNKPKPVPPDDYKPPESLPNDLVGANCCARFSPDGNGMFFISRERVRHPHAQVYFYDFSSRSERRITHHDGDDQGVAVHPTGKWIFYASTTDEDKESPEFLRRATGDLAGESLKLQIDIGQRAPWRNQPFEIYRSLPDGSQIQRLTDQPGLDAEIALSPKGGEFLFTSLRLNRAAIFRFDLESQNVTPLTTGSNQEGEPSFSPDGAAWSFIRYSEDRKSSQVWIQEKGRRPKPLTSGEGIRRSPRWHPNGSTLIFSSNSNDPENFELYLIKRDGTCMRQLTFELGQDGLGEFSPDGKSIVFTSDRSGVNQLYRMDFSPPPCP